MYQPTTIEGVGTFWGSVGNFFESGLGQTLLDVGTQLGSVYVGGLIADEFGGGSSGGGGGGVAPPQQQQQPQTPIIIQQPAPAQEDEGFDTQTLIIGGVAAVAAYALLQSMSKRRR